TRYSPQPRPSCPQGQTCDTGANNWLGVDLGADTALSKLFLYDVAVSGATGLIVEGSDDGTAWRALASATAKPYLALPLVGSARYVRVRLLSATAEFRGSGNAELAIY
ncbi:MAG TPA: discoidin domain-containing protein, partial [Myxococcota bacterium]|nr:discoidin domain-containing protein [Myxococcota bacterium]